jgi:hypothetical protein
MRRCCSTFAAPEIGGAFGNLGASSIDDICERSNGRRPALVRRQCRDVRRRIFAGGRTGRGAQSKALKCIFAPFAWSDAYRDRYYQGGISNWGFSKIWFETLPETVFEPDCETWGRERASQAVAPRSTIRRSLGAVPVNVLKTQSRVATA